LYAAKRNPHFGVRLRRLLIPFEVFRIGVARLTAAWGGLDPHTALQNILRELAAEKKRAEP
jgi:hypothetical protein